MEGVVVVSISDLLRRRRSISGASSLLPSSPSLPPLSPSTTAASDQNPNPNSNADLKVLTSLPRPSIIVGTITLPPSQNLSPSSGHSCLSFTGDSASVCCDVPRFDVCMIGRMIHVLAWNFIPLRHHGGFLEIIDWKFSEGSALDDGVDVLPLFPGEVIAREESCKARYGVHGLLMSVSPVSAVPCTDSSLGNEGDCSSRSTVNSCGFVVQIFSCVCKLCSSRDISWSYHHSIAEQDCHSFSKEVFVLFSGSAASWHPAFAKLVGNIISLHRLSKKLVYIAKEDGVSMFVCTCETRLYLPKLRSKGLPKINCGIKGKGECGDYSGLVRGVYMKGMIVELDEEVWLLLTDPLLTPPHSIRVGAVIFLRNVHFVNPNFPWRKMLIIGACCKTSINVVSFSPLEARCHLPLQSSSMLGKYVQCLPFSAKLWLLLVVQCFRKKFDGVFSEKELLGSKHCEGLVQSYARSMLPSSQNHAMQGVLVQFCKHGVHGCHIELNCGNFILVVPFLNFLNSCEVLWMKSLLQSRGGLELIQQIGLRSHCLLNSRFSGQVMRRSFPSQHLGVSLLGNLKVSPCTGRLQLVDATGCIDAMVLDLPSTWCTAEIYEVIDYTLVLEGVPERMDNLAMLDSDSFSCRSIFIRDRSHLETGLSIHVFFPWRNAISRSITLCDGLSCNRDLVDKCGIFHLLHVTHIFPLQSHLQGDAVALDRSSLLAEAVALSCNLYVVENEDAARHVDISKQQEEEHGLSGFSCKRLKIDNTCNMVQASGVNCAEAFVVRPCSHSIDFSTLFQKGRSEQKSYFSNCMEFPCLATIGGPHGESVVNCRILFPNRGEGGATPSSKLKKVLLEFKPEYFLKYKVMRIGTYYISKHCVGECFCDCGTPNYCDKIIIGPGRHLWSLSFSSNEFLSNLDPSCNQSSHFSNNDISVVGYKQDELLIHSFNAHDHDVFTDVRLQASREVIGILYHGGQESKKESVMTTGTSYEPKFGRTSISSSVQFSGTSHLDCPLLEGDLISVSGKVTAIYCSDGRCINEYSCKGNAGGIHQLKLLQGRGIFISCQVLADGHMVEIYGTLSKFNYPVGLGPGANVSFHRILTSGRQNHLMLLPVSFISVNSVEDGACASHSWFSSHPSRFGFVPQEIISSPPICDLNKFNEGEYRSLYCRVVAVHVLMFRRNKSLDKLLSEIQGRIPVVDIPLAGLVLDDGTSPCCCWANAERAATFLRLHDEMPRTPFGRNWWEVPRVVADQHRSTLIFHLDEMLKKHGCITVKNYGSVHHSWFQDPQFDSSSDCKISSVDENVLKFMVLNACSGALMKVTGRVINSDAASELEKCVIGEQVNMDHMPNMWVEEVQVVDPLAEARAIFQSL